MTRLILCFAATCLLIGCGVGRVAAWLHLGKKMPRAIMAVLAAVLVAGIYGMAATPPYFGTAIIILPFAIGFGAGNSAFLAALVGQGVLTWIVALLFFRGFCWLRKYDEDFAKKHGGAGRRG